MTTTYKTDPNLTYLETLENNQYEHLISLKPNQKESLSDLIIPEFLDYYLTSIQNLETSFNWFQEQLNTYLTPNKVSLLQVDPSKFPKEISYDHHLHLIRETDLICPLYPDTKNLGGIFKILPFFAIINTLPPDHFQEEIYSPYIPSPDTRDKVTGLTAVEELTIAIQEDFQFGGGQFK